MLAIVFYAVMFLVVLILYFDNVSLKKQKNHIQEEYDKLMKKHGVLEHTKENLVKSSTETHSQLQRLEEIEQENYRLKLMLKKQKGSSQEL